MSRGYGSAEVVGAVEGVEAFGIIGIQLGGNDFGKAISVIIFQPDTVQVFEAGDTAGRVSDEGGGVAVPSVGEEALLDGAVWEVNVTWKKDNIQRIVFKILLSPSRIISYPFKKPGGIFQLFKGWLSIGERGNRGRRRGKSWAY
jgi:hypothetical protein